MSRDDGFAIADVDSSYFDDAKLRDLWRRLKDESAMARAVCLHLSTLVASWRQGERVTLAQAAPLWLDDDAELVAHLQACDLLDAECRVPSDAFDRWFGAAVARRDVRRSAGRAGGLASAKQRSTNREATVEQPLTPAEPVRPSVRPTDKPTVQPAASVARTDGLPNLNSTVAAIWEEATGRTVLASGAKVAEQLDDACRRHPPSEVGAAILRARRTFDHIPEVNALASALRRLLDPFPDGKATEAARREAEAQAASRRRSEDTLRRTHDLGAHENAPRPNCPSCKGEAA